MSDASPRSPAQQPPPLSSAQTTAAQTSAQTTGSQPAVLPEQIVVQVVTLDDLDLEVANSGQGEVNEGERGPVEANNAQPNEQVRPEPQDEPVPSTSRGRKTTSPIWDHFKRTADPKYVTCNHCDTKVL